MKILSNKIALFFLLISCGSFLNASSTLARFDDITVFTLQEQLHRKMTSDRPTVDELMRRFDSFLDSKETSWTGSVPTMAQLLNQSFNRFEKTSQQEEKEELRLKLGKSLIQFIPAVFLKKYHFFASQKNGPQKLTKPQTRYYHNFLEYVAGKWIKTLDENCFQHDYKIESNTEVIPGTGKFECFDGNHYGSNEKVSSTQAIKMLFFGHIISGDYYFQDHEERSQEAAKNIKECLTHGFDRIVR